MEIKTSRLYIRNLCESDWIDIKNIFVDFNNSRYAIYDRPLPIEDDKVKALVKQFADSNLFFTIHTSYNNKMVGYVCFHKDEDKYDLGYCFHSAYHAKGYAYESVNALIKYIAQAYRVSSFKAGTAIDNKPSCRLLEKLGFICVSTETVSFDNLFSFQGGDFELNME